MSYKASTSKEISEREKEHAAIVRALAPEGMVVLLNDGVLPLKAAQPVALFGTGARRTVKGGTGSGDVNSRSVVNAEQGLKNAGFSIMSGDWLDAYDAKYAEAERQHKAVMKQRMDAGENPVAVYFTQPFPAFEVPALPEKPLCGLAVYVISRNSGEGKDRDACRGDWFLTEREEADLTLLANTYEKLIVLLNIGGVMDTRFFRSLKGLSALVLMSQAGADTGDALADALLGVTEPSGRLTDTWAEDYGDYPSSATFSHNDGNVAEEPYSEGIYVGYRYFDTFGKPVAFPFGYGLGYTQFKITGALAEAKTEGISVRVQVKNIGALPGRETAQLYVSAPESRLEKPYQVLAAFGKTALLQSGETQELTLTFPLRNMASYCSLCHSWVLEAGDYVLRLGHHSRDTFICGVVTVPERLVLEQLRALRPSEVKETLHRAEAKPITYEGESAELSAATRMTLTGTVETRIPVYADADVFDTPAPAEQIGMEAVLSGKYTLAQLTAQLTPAELARLCVGEFGDRSTIGNAGKDVPGAAGQTIHGLEARGIGSLVLADGPAGVRLTRHFRTDAQGVLLPEEGGLKAALTGEEPSAETPAGAIDYYQFCTAIPIATMIAQSWNPALAQRFGALAGREMAEYGVHSWLAPGMNIHRNPLCGRNFEYYSEDPLIAGVFAAADTLGVQSVPGVGTTPKHFLLNNQEDNRNYSDSMVSEQAMREIYLRGFEICVRSAQPMFLMTSYNFINGVHAANSRDVLTDVLRSEWGFGGLVMTDWGTTGGGNLMEKAGEDSTPEGCIAAGNDLIEPGCQADVDGILTALAEGRLSMDSLRTCALRILTVIAGSSLYENAKPWSGRFKLEKFLSVK